jgi:hypothetical protein
MATVIQQLHAMAGLAENWDGYGAAVPDGQIIELAEEFVRLMEALLANRSAGSCTLHVSPTRIGGVLIEWEDVANQNEVEIHPDRSFGFLHLIKATGLIETRKLFPASPAVVQPAFLQALSQLLAA